MGVFSCYPLQIQPPQPLTWKVHLTCPILSILTLDVWNIAQYILNYFGVGHLITTLHGDICIQAAQGVLVERQYQVGLCVPLDHAQVLGAPLTFLGEIPCSHGCLVHSGYAQL